MNLNPLTQTPPPWPWTYVAKYQLEQAAMSIILEPFAFSSEQYGVGFAGQRGALRDQVQASLDEMKQDGTFMKLAKKYSSKTVIKQ